MDKNVDNHIKRQVVKKIVMVKRRFINPEYNQETALKLASIGEHYNTPKTIVLTVPEEQTRIKYQYLVEITCQQCHLKALSVKKTAKYCSQGCKETAYYNKRKNAKIAAVLPSKNEETPL